MTEHILNLLPVNEADKAAFKAIAPDAVHTYAGRRTVTPEQLAEATIILGWPRAADMKHCKKLKWFQAMWAGTDEYMGEGILPEGIILTSSSGSNRSSVAEHMMAEWLYEGQMKSVYGSTVLIVGAGNIGATLAGMCKGLGAHTIGLKRSLTPVAGFDEIHTMDKLDELLPKADMVVLVVPHSPETEGLMSEERLRLMKDDAILVSSGRGSVLDQEGLVKVMGEGKLWGAALDVTVPEPLPADHPLWDIPNLVLTPHVAGGMRLEITRSTCIRMAQDNLRRYLAGEPLKNRVL